MNTKIKQTRTSKKRDNQTLQITLPSKSFEDYAYIKNYYHDTYRVSASSSVIMQVALDLQAHILERISVGHREQKSYTEAASLAMREMKRLHSVIAKQHTVESTFKADDRNYHSPDPSILYLTRKEYAANGQ